MSMSEILKKNFLKSIGTKPNYQIINESKAYNERGFLTTEDTEEIIAAVEEYKKRRAESAET